VDTAASSNTSLPLVAQVSSTSLLQVVLPGLRAVLVATRRLQVVLLPVTLVNRPTVALLLPRRDTRGMVNVDGSCSDLYLKRNGFLRSS